MQGLLMVETTGGAPPRLTLTARKKARKQAAAEKRARAAVQRASTDPAEQPPPQGASRAGWVDEAGRFQVGYSREPELCRGLTVWQRAALERVRADHENAYERALRSPGFEVFIPGGDSRDVVLAERSAAGARLEALAGALKDDDFVILIAFVMRTEELARLIRDAKLSQSQRRTVSKKVRDILDRTYEFYTGSLPQRAHNPLRDAARAAVGIGVWRKGEDD